ncbi:MAG: family 16 glycoside hydrolase [Actinomycetota bacterium]
MTAPTETRPADESAEAHSSAVDTPSTADAAPPIDTPPPTASGRTAMDNLKYGALAVVVLLGAVIAIGNLSGATSSPRSADADTAALAVIASDIVTSAKSDGNAIDAIGGYLPGTGIVLTVQLGDTGNTPTEQWVSNHLDPFAETLAIMPADESIVVTINEVEGDNARVWSLPVAALGTSVRDWNQLVAPASFQSNEVAVAAPEPPVATETEDTTDTEDTAEAEAQPVAEAEPAIEPEPAPEPEAAEPEPAPEPEAAEPEPAPDPEPEPEPAPEPAPEPEPVENSADNGDGRNDGIGGFGDGEFRVVSAFDNPDNFSPNFGSWVLRDGVYSQQDATGFGYSAGYQGDLPDWYDVSVDMRAPNGDLNAGIIYGLPDSGRKHGGKVVDLTAESTYLRWGEYDPESGDWGFIGGAPIDPGLPQDEWQNLKLEVRPEGTSVILNDNFIATLDPVEAGQEVALVVSVANVEFKDFFVTEPGGEPIGTDVTEEAPGDLVDLRPNTGDGIEVGDGFDGDIDYVVFDDELREWNLLSGQWTATDGLLTQGNGQAYDQMVHFSNFEQDDYRVQVDLRAKEGSIFSGGVLFNIQTFGQRANSQLFDIVDDGQVIRWAGYDQNGVFSYVGGLRTSAGFDPDDWHTIAVEVRDGRAEFFIDGEFVGASDDVGDAGYVGLVTSLAAMDFRNFSIITLG